MQRNNDSAILPRINTYQDLDRLSNQLLREISKTYKTLSLLTITHTSAHLMIDLLGRNITQLHTLLLEMKKDREKTINIPAVDALGNAEEIKQTNSELGKLKFLQEKFFVNNIQLILDMLNKIERDEYQQETIELPSQINTTYYSLSVFARLNKLTLDMIENPEKIDTIKLTELLKEIDFNIEHKENTYDDKTLALDKSYQFYKNMKMAINILAVLAFLAIGLSIATGGLGLVIGVPIMCALTAVVLVNYDVFQAPAKDNLSEKKKAVNIAKKNDPGLKKMNTLLFAINTSKNITEKIEEVKKTNLESIKPKNE